MRVKAKAKAASGMAWHDASPGTMLFPSTASYTRDLTFSKADPPAACLVYVHPEVTTVMVIYCYCASQGSKGLGRPAIPRHVSFGRRPRLVLVRS
jgi:hypothetical protein